MTGMVGRPRRTVVFKSDFLCISNKRTDLTLTLRMLHASHAFCNLDLPSITWHATDFLYSVFHEIAILAKVRPWL